MVDPAPRAMTARSFLTVVEGNARNPSRSPSVPRW